MSEANKQIARTFLAALGAANLPDELVTSDFTAWTTTRGEVPGAAYRGGVKMFGTLFPDGLTYTVTSLTAEDDRVAAEVSAAGTLKNGQAFANTYMFLLKIRDGKVASVAEHFNPQPVVDMILPLLAVG